MLTPQTTTTVRMYIVNAGTLTQLTPDITVTTLTAGNTLTLTVTGTTLTVLRNGVLVGSSSRTDSTYLTGAPGVYGFGTGANGSDSFTAVSL